MRRILLIAVVLTLPVIVQSGCGAARPSKYYQLDAPAPAATSPDPLPISLLVGRISSSRLFHDDRIIYETSPLELGMYEYHRWAEPPSDMVQGMLVQALRASGQYRSVDRLGSSARGDYILRGRLLALRGSGSSQHRRKSQFRPGTVQCENRHNGVDSIVFAR